ncbi:methionyl-tRNA formyltransferase [Helicobacter ailurogastricus]|uniref:methionyl-tRNA formyltransferase n=1 Tax=Helicobacter ailurogastricus TaxID=1578720 RepID=UPI0022BD8FAE|nr:methionyl-tRNA formyltransferase [Helicobacter ailurogastricus]GLH57267.1 Methionyl-tRNA formyltransferase Fmt [Helicobacter ailurogastricus]GLH59192.1 Methionyl-tRNA formyltransferase Fmt [Helicobacter ailurogastricus]GMB91218.1 Methionyl-tRNA formyltransferase Fmt [Helicobacter ailurogastricus]
MRVLFMGTPVFARVVLQQLILEDFKIVGLVTQPSKPFGRHYTPKDSATKSFILENHPHIPILEPAKIDEEALQAIAKLNPQMIVVVAYGKILPQTLLDLAPCLNLHGSILPQFRGASPMQEMILHDLKTFGVSVILMNAKMDEGGILGVASFEKDRDYNLQDLGARLALLGAKLMVSVLKNFKDITPTPQDHSQATYCKKISKADGLIDFSDARQVYLKFLAYYPWPGVFLPSGLKLFGLELLSTEEQRLEGEILTLDGEGVLVGCAKGVLRIAQLQAPGKQKVGAKAYLSGKRLKVGDILS